jgi:hypothetical protein
MHPEMDVRQGAELTTSAQGSGREDQAGGAAAAARLLEMAARDADAWRAEARGEAEQLVRAGREQAASLVEEAEARAGALVAAARDEAERTRAASAEERRVHDEEVARLDALERGHRERLREHLTSVLAEVDGPSAGQYAASHREAPGAAGVQEG